MSKIITTKIWLLSMKGIMTENLRGSLAAALYETSTFLFETAAQGENRFSGAEEGNMYSRLGIRADLRVHIGSSWYTESEIQYLA